MSQLQVCSIISFHSVAPAVGADIGWSRAGKQRLRPGRTLRSRLCCGDGTRHWSDAAERLEYGHSRMEREKPSRS